MPLNIACALVYRTCTELIEIIFSSVQNSRIRMDLAVHRTTRWTSPSWRCQVSFVRHGTIDEERLAVAQPLNRETGHGRHVSPDARGGAAGPRATTTPIQ